VTDGVSTLSVPVLYAFRQGKPTDNVLQVNDRFYESRLSFYNDIQDLISRSGFRAKTGIAAEALGRPISNDETLQCFSCMHGAVSGISHLDK